MADRGSNMVFADDVVEKVGRLARVLESIGEHPRLRGNLALHGGTALNLFLLKPERLSLDLDLNYIASEDRRQMLDDRQRYVDAVCAVGEELGFDARSGKLGHAGCTVKLHYRSDATGLPDFVKVDLDFLSRTWLLPPCEREMTYGDYGTRFLVNSPIEVVAGKVKATTERTVPRDLFDIARIGKVREAWTTGDALLDRRIIIYYAVLSNRFPNHGGLADRSRFEGRESDFDRILRPVLPADSILTYEELLDGAIPVLEEFACPADAVEEEFTARLAAGELDVGLLFGCYPEIAERAARNPTALHKLEGIRTAIERGIIGT